MGAGRQESLTDGQHSPWMTLSCASCSFQARGGNREDFVLRLGNFVAFYLIVGFLVVVRLIDYNLVR